MVTGHLHCLWNTLCYRYFACEKYTDKLFTVLNKLKTKTLRKTHLYESPKNILRIFFGAVE